MHIDCFYMSHVYLNAYLLLILDHTSHATNKLYMMLCLFNVIIINKLFTIKHLSTYLVLERPRLSTESSQHYIVGTTQRYKQAMVSIACREAGIDFREYDRHLVYSLDFIFILFVCYRCFCYIFLVIPFHRIAEFDNP